MMGYDSHPAQLPGGPDRDEADHAQLRHGRHREAGFSVGRYLQPAPMLFTRDGHNVFLGDAYRGQTVFLVCAGPSLNQHSLKLLDQRGIVTCAVNNAGTIIRPNLWVSVDDPANFADAIWRDPAITKFVPLCHMEKPISTRNETGEIVLSDLLVGDMPAVFGYRRNEAFNAEQWLFEDTFNWGNHSQRVDAHGVKGSRSVMLVALRLLFFLGFRRVYLLGCDFRMNYGAQNYAFEQHRSRSSVNGNNGTYHALNIRLGALKPHFEKEGFEVLNCTPDSGLTVFQYVPFEQSIEAAITTFPKTINTAGMYDRSTKKNLADELPSYSDQQDFAEDPVSSFDLPPLTAITAVDRSSLDTFYWTWQTWMRHRESLLSMPCRILHDPRERIHEDLRMITQRHAKCELVPVIPDGDSTGRDRWSHAYLRAADAINTPWYLRLDPEAVACRKSRWLSPQWFQVAGGDFAFASHAWNYTKPAHVFKLLDDWAQAIPEFADGPSLDVRYEEQGNTAVHDTISSWFFLGNTAWTRKLLLLAPHRLPCPSHEAFMVYCATRLRTPILRMSMKALGWDHSFSKKWSAIDLSRNVLGQPN